MRSVKNFEARIDVPVLTRYKIHEIGSSVVKSKKEKLYNYIICDYCGEEIKLEKDVTKRTGGIVEIPIGSYKKVVLGLCNKCLKPTLNLVRKEYGIEI